MKIEYSIEVLPEETPVRGNCIATDDPDFDRDYEDKILADLEAGNTWAWCQVKVTASAGGMGGMEGTDYLGCCSYKDEADFRQCDYYASMQKMAADELRAKIAGIDDEPKKPIIVALGNDGILYVKDVPAGYTLEVRDCR